MVNWTCRFLLTAVQSVFDQNVDNIFGANSTSFKKSEPALHEHDKSSHDQQKELNNISINFISEQI